MYFTRFFNYFLRRKEEEFRWFNYKGSFKCIHGEEVVEEDKEEEEAKAEDLGEEFFLWSISDIEV